MQFDQVRNSNTISRLFGCFCWRYLMKLIITILILCATLTSGSVAADFAKGGTAIQRGDFAEAYKELKPLAEQGNVRAQFNIALMYDSGLGVTLDYVEAAKWYRKAAEQGLADAQHNLAVIYAGGKGFEQDLVKTYFWFDLAAASGMDTAERNRDTAASNMTAQQIAEARRKVQEWLEKHPAK